MAWRELGMHVRQWRQARRLRIEDVAVRAGVSRSWLSNLERGHTVKVDYIARLAAYMGDDASRLLRLAGVLPGGEAEAPAPEEPRSVQLLRSKADDLAVVLRKRHMSPQEQERLEQGIESAFGLLEQIAQSLGAERENDEEAG